MSEQKLYLSLREIKILSKSFNIQNHTYSHKPLSSLEYSEICCEIKSCRDVLSKITGKEPKCLCPSGDPFKKEVWEVAKN